MNRENFYVFVEEGGAGRAIIAQAPSHKQAAQNIQAQIGRNPRFAEGATQAFRSHDLLTRSFADNKKSNVIKFERREPFVEKLLSAENGHDKAAEPKAGPVRFFHEGPNGKVGISFNDRTLAWQAHCCPEGGGGREVTLPLTVTGEEQAAREAVAVLRDEATHNRQIVPRPTREEAAVAVKTLIAY